MSSTAEVPTSVITAPPSLNRRKNRPPNKLASASVISPSITPNDNDSPNNDNDDYLDDVNACNNNNSVLDLTSKAKPTSVVVSNINSVVWDGCQAKKTPLKEDENGGGDLTNLLASANHNDDAADTDVDAAVVFDGTNRSTRDAAAALGVDGMSDFMSMFVASAQQQQQQQQQHNDQLNMNELSRLQQPYSNILMNQTPASAGFDGAGAMFNRLSASAAAAASSTFNNEDFCEICRKHFCNKYYLRKHAKDLHSIDVPKDPDVNCEEYIRQLVIAGIVKPVAQTQNSNNSNNNNASPVLNQNNSGNGLNLKAAVTPRHQMAPLSKSLTLNHQDIQAAGNSDTNGVASALSSLIMLSQLQNNNASAQHQLQQQSQQSTLGNADDNESSLSMLAKRILISQQQQHHPAGLVGQLLGDVLLAKQQQQQQQSVNTNVGPLTIDASNEHSRHEDEASMQWFNGGSSNAVKKEAETPDHLINAATDGGGTGIMTNEGSVHCDTCPQPGPRFASVYLLQMHKSHAHNVPLNICGGNGGGDRGSKQTTNNGSIMGAGLTAMDTAQAAKLADRVQCDICLKFVCNKYFLKHHKWKVHGIAMPSNGNANATEGGSNQSGNGDRQTPNSGSSPAPSTSPSNDCNVNNNNPSNLTKSSRKSKSSRSSKSKTSKSHSHPQLSDLPTSFDETSTQNNSGNNAAAVAAALSSVFCGNSAGGGASNIDDNVIAAAAGGGSGSGLSRDDLLQLITKSFMAQQQQPTNSGNMPKEEVSPANVFGNMIKSAGMPSTTQTPIPSHGKRDSSDSGRTAHSSASANPMPPALQQITADGKYPYQTAKGDVQWRQWRWKDSYSNSRVTCEFCLKELCNKYFLRTHKLNKHGIAEDGTIVDMTKYEMSFNESTPNHNQSANTQVKSIQLPNETPSSSQNIDNNTVSPSSKPIAVTTTNLLDAASKLKDDEVDSETIGKDRNEPHNGSEEEENSQLLCIDEGNKEKMHVDEDVTDENDVPAIAAETTHHLEAISNSAVARSVLRQAKERYQHNGHAAHSQTALNIKLPAPSQCEDCDATFFNSQVFAIHARQAHGRIIPRRRRLQQQHCGMASKRRRLTINAGTTSCHQRSTSSLSTVFSPPTPSGSGCDVSGVESLATNGAEPEGKKQFFRLEIITTTADENSAGDGDDGNLPVQLPKTLCLPVAHLVRHSRTLNIRLSPLHNS